MNRYISYYLAGILLVTSSCATTNLARDKTSFANFCENGRAKKQYIFVLAAYSGVASGVPIQRVKSIVESSNETTAFIKDHFVQAMLVNYYGERAESAEPVLERNNALYTLFQQKFVRGYAPVLPHLVWVKDNKFAACQDAQCDGGTFPESANVIIRFDNQKWNDGRCHDFFLEDGYIAGWGCYGNKKGLLSYMKQGGFNGGWLVANSYLSVPESQKQTLCREAGKPVDCFGVFSSQENYIKFRDSLSESDFPFLWLVTGYPNTWSDFQKRLAESAFSKDLALKAGTKVSTKNLKNWTLHRITWDPSLFCKYGRPNEDFYSD